MEGIEAGRRAPGFPLIDANRSYRLGLLLVTVGTVCWSAAGFFTRLITVDAGTLVFWRGLFGALTALAVLAVQRRGRILSAFGELRGPGWLFCVVSAVGMFTFLSALRMTTVAHVSIIYATIPFVAAGMGWVVLREKLDGATLAASVVAFAGVVVTVAAGLGEGTRAGDLMAVAMTLLMGVMIVIARRHPAIPMIPAAFVSAVLATLLGMPTTAPGVPGVPDLIALALFGASNMALGLILVTEGSKLIPAVETALIGAMEGPLGPLWVWLAFGETPLATTVAGGALVMAAVLGHVVAAARRPAA